MVKPEWGTKRQCPSCGARFYDLQHHPVTCPKCQTTFEPEALLKPRRTRPEPVEKRVPRKAVVVPDEIEEDQEEEVEEEIETTNLKELDEDEGDAIEDDAIEEEVEETGARRRRVTAIEPEEDLIDIEEAETEASDEEDEGDILDDAEPLPDEDEES